MMASADNTKRKKTGGFITSNYTSDVESLNFLQGVLHDDLADKLKEVITGKGKLTANDFDDILPKLTSKLDPDEDSMSDILSANDIKILGLVLAQGHLTRLKQMGLNIEDTRPGQITKEKVADALKQIGQDRLALVLRDKRGIQKLQSEIYRTVYINALKDPRSFTVDLQVLRMVLCGVPRSGKTTFWKRLVREDFNTEELSQSTPLAEQHHIHVNHVSMEMAMLYDWHLCSDDDSLNSKNELDKEVLVIYRQILESYNSNTSVERDAALTPSSSMEMTLHSKQNEPKDQGIVQAGMSSGQELNKPVHQQSVDEISKEIVSIFENLQKNLTSVGDIPDVSTLRQLINLSDIGGQRAFLELLPILSTGSALYLIFFSYGTPLNRPLPDQYQGPTKSFNLANEYSQIEVVMQSLRCVATSSFTDNSSKDIPNHISSDRKFNDSDVNVTALLVGTHTDTRSDQPGIDNVDHYIQLKVKGFLDSETNILEYANVVNEQLVLEVNNKTESKEEFKQYQRVLMEVVQKKFSRNIKQLPGSWLMFTIILRKMKIAGRSVLQYEHCKYIASKLFIPHDETTLKGLLHFMHNDLGILMYFPEVPCLRHLVICNPAVVFTTISEIIIPTFTDDVAKMSTQKFLLFKKYGVFAYQTVNSLISEKKGFLEANRLIPLLQHLGVVAPIEFSELDTESDKKFECTPGHDHIGDSLHCIHAEYIIPCVLKGTTSAEDKQIEQHCNKHCMIAPLIITFECKFAPMGGFCYLFTRLLTEKKSNWKPYLPEIHAPGKCPIDRLLCRNKVTFIVEKKFYVSLVATANHFKVFIVRGDSNDQTGYEFVCHEVWKAIKDALSSCPNPQVRRFKTAFRCSGHTRDYQHNEHLMIVDRPRIKSAKLTAECEEEKREIPIDTDNQSIMVWFKGPFKLVREPLSDLRRSFGEEIMLTVFTTPDTKCTYLWKRTGKELKPNDSLCVGSNSETLHFKRFCKMYEGTYTCIVMDAEYSESLSATLTFDAPEEFKVSMNDKDFYAYLNGKGLPLDDCDKMRDFVITAKDFSEQCVPSDISEDGKRKLDVILRGLRPRISKQPESLRKYCSEEAVLMVNAEGPGPIKYQWQKEGKDITNEKLYEGAKSRKLKINYLQSRHAGLYSCIIENEHGTMTSKQVNLTLKIKITEEMQTISAHFHQKAKIEVSATGQEPLEYQWKKDGKVIHDDDSDYSRTNTNILIIKSMSEKLQGNYKCVVSNYVDEEESCEISLTLERKQRSDHLSLTSKPVLYELILIEGGDKKVRVRDRVAAEWEEVATRLYFEGYDIKRIKKDNHHQSREACHAMLSEWLEGNGREPKTWETIIKALEEAQLSEVAKELSNIIIQDHSP